MESGIHKRKNSKLLLEWMAIAVATALVAACNTFELHFTSISIHLLYYIHIQQSPDPILKWISPHCGVCELYKFRTVHTNSLSFGLKQ